MTQAKIKKSLGLALKILFVGGLLTLLFKKGFISLKDTRNALHQWDKVGPAFAVMALSSVLGVVRWQWLLRAQGIELSWQRVLQLTYVGNFFNIALPGAVSGDFVKAFYIGKELPGNRTRAFGSILFDRVAGVTALGLLSGGALLLGIGSFRGTALFVALRILILAAATGVLAFYAYLFLVREHHDPLLRLLKALDRRIPKFSALTRIYESLRHYHHHRGAVLKALGLSILIHMMVGWACLSFDRALGDLDPALLTLYVVVPLGLLMTAIPGLPGGIGTGHAAFFYLFHLIGSQHGADVFTLLVMVNIGIGAVGGIFYLRFRTNDPELLAAT